MRKFKILGLAVIGVLSIANSSEAQFTHHAYSWGRAVNGKKPCIRTDDNGKYDPYGPQTTVEDHFCEYVDYYKVTPKNGGPDVCYKFEATKKGVEGKSGLADLNNAEDKKGCEKAPNRPREHYEWDQDAHGLSQCYHVKYLTDDGEATTELVQDSYRDKDCNRILLDSKGKTIQTTYVLKYWHDKKMCFRVSKGTQGEGRNDFNEMIVDASDRDECKTLFKADGESCPGTYQQFVNEVNARQKH